MWIWKAEVSETLFFPSARSCSTVQASSELVSILQSATVRDLYHQGYECFNRKINRPIPVILASTPTDTIVGCVDPVPWRSLVPDRLCRMRIVTCTRPKLHIHSCIEHSVPQIGNHAVCQILEKCREHSFTLQQLGPKWRHVVPSGWHDLPFVSPLPTRPSSDSVSSV